jgi:membrane protein DedA with SNARE-associated domain
VRDLLSRLFEHLLSAPDFVVYLVLGILAAVENVFPPVPADVVVLFGGVLAGYGGIDPWAVFLIVWICNVSSALLVYGIGRRYGPAFFAGPWGHMLLRPGQLRTLGIFYRRFGPGVIFLSRFLPGFRAIVPPFAGVTGVGFWKAAVPLAVASAIWYGGIVYVGYVFGSNWEVILGALNRSSRAAGIVATVAFTGLVVWWWRSRAHKQEQP